MGVKTNYSNVGGGMFYDSLVRWVQKKYPVLHLIGLMNALFVLAVLWWPRPLDTLGRTIFTLFFVIFGCLFPSLYLMAFRSLERRQVRDASQS